MAPIKFSDIASGPSDLLSDDYTSKVTLKCKKNAGPVAVTIETNRGSGGDLTSKIGTKFSYAGLSFDKVQLQADGNQVFESSMSPASGVKLSFKGNKGADLGCDYKTGNICATGKLDVKDFSKLSTSVCASLSSGITVGGDASYSIEKSSISAFNVGASYSKGPLFAAATSANKISSVTLGLLYKVNPTLTLASTSTHSSEKPCDLAAVGGAYKSGFGDIKAKVESSGLVSACIVKEIAPKVSVTASGSVTPSDFSTFKYGLGISM
mmetsp:Transcript_18484/g.26022  ORF Transcript_18484/g.26022 Transcript_18484/m.26022 type:complete len:266 (+) Transcript_18484:68-865(+)|eukprot:CAMPEP_0184872798 /NCGR_PEP_ID=MMETSP0580-20130426/41490_1 /TAXON_ID=1118495 /ORGANISM="Dactyliosolen fragilissimus" /LENGTH=265 /DNA_ID=CAMNT_0027375641 /DNA_START=445 /DNA_END=1242 /DNA_ORIENTATION=+